MNDPPADGIGFSRDIDYEDDRRRCERHPDEVLDPEGRCESCLAEEAELFERDLAAHDAEEREPEPPEEDDVDDDDGPERPEDL